MTNPLFLFIRENNMDEFLKAVVTSEREDCIRVGQHYFNTLWKIRPDIANEIRGTMNDPFHNDKKLGQFILQVAELW